MYGVGVDDANGNVWVTNTRQSTVAVYKASDLSLVKQFDQGIGDHSRDVVVDQKRNRAYVSLATSNVILVFDTKTLEQLPSIALAEGSKAMSLEVDSKTGKLYTVSLAPKTGASTAYAAVIDTTKNNEITEFPLSKTTAASGVAYDPTNSRIWAVSQQAENNVEVLDASTGEVLYVADAGKRPLNVAFDTVGGLAYVTDFGGSTTTVFDADGQLVGAINTGTKPNHVTTTGNGEVWVVNKGGEGATDNSVWRIAQKSVALGSVEVSGGAKTGKTLTAVAVGTSKGAQLSYQWYLSGKSISGETGATYTVKASDLGKKLTVKVTGEKDGYTTVTKSSSAKKVSKKN